MPWFDIAVFLIEFPVHPSSLCRIHPNRIQSSSADKDGYTALRIIISSFCVLGRLAPRSTCAVRLETWRTTARAKLPWRIGKEVQKLKHSCTHPRNLRGNFSVIALRSLPLNGISYSLVYTLPSVLIHVSSILGTFFICGSCFSYILRAVFNCVFYSCHTLLHTPFLHFSNFFGTAQRSLIPDTPSTLAWLRAELASLRCCKSFVTSWAIPTTILLCMCAHTWVTDNAERDLIQWESIPLNKVHHSHALPGRHSFWLKWMTDLSSHFWLSVLLAKFVTH